MKKLIIGAIIVVAIIAGVILVPNLGEYFTGRVSQDLIEKTEVEGQDLLPIGKILFPGTTIEFDKPLNVKTVGEVKNLIKQNTEVLKDFVSVLDPEEQKLTNGLIQKVYSAIDEEFIDSEIITIEVSDKLKNFTIKTIENELSEDGKDLYDVLFNNSFAIKTLRIEDGLLSLVDIANIATYEHTQIIKGKSDSYNVLKKIQNELKGTVYSIENGEIKFNEAFIGAQLEISNDFEEFKYSNALTNQRIELNKL